MLGFLFRTTCMGLQKQGKEHNNSITGRRTAIGLEKGKVLAYEIKSKLCRTCSYASRKRQVKQEDCRNSRNDSSKAMELSVACEL